MNDRTLKVEVAARKRPVDPNDNREEMIGAFLQEIKRFENSLAYSYLDVRSVSLDMGQLQSLTHYQLVL